MKKLLFIVLFTIMLYSCNTQRGCGTKWKQPKTLKFKGFL